MCFQKLFIVAIVFLTSSLFALNNPSDLFEITIVDSLSYETLGTGLKYWGYGDVHLATNGQRIILAAKKTYKDPTTNQAKTHLLFGERQGFGKWNFENVYDYQDSLYFGFVKPMLMHGVMPIIFFHDRINAYPTELKFVNRTGTGDWVPTVMNTDVIEDKIRDFYINGSFGVSQGDDGATVYWFRGVSHELSPGSWHEKKVLVSQNWGLNEKKVIWETDYDEDVNLTPVVTEDGEYIAISHFTFDTLHTYWVIRVLRRTSDGYVEELADSVIYDGSYYYQNYFSFAIGKQKNGDVLLIAGVNLGKYIYRRTINGWTKLVDNYPSGGGIGAQTASGRGLANERLQFSSDGTAFWGDVDGWGTYHFSAEISFYTPEGSFGYIQYPQLPGFPWGYFYHHDFCITADDTLHIIYNYQPYIENAPIYLVEGKLYIPDLLNSYAAIANKSNKQQLKNFALAQNYPNPFNPITTIHFSTAKQMQVTLKVFDILGREIATLVDGKLTPGEHKVIFDGKNLPSGVYIYRLQAGDYYQQRKMILMK